MSFIDPKLISNDQIKSAILSYLSSVPDQARWKDFQSSSIGLTNIELLSGVGSFLAHRILLEGQESSLFSARNRSSIIARAENLGYSVGRGTPAQVTISVTNNTGSGFSYELHEVVGKYNNLYDLVAVGVAGSGVSINAGETKDVSMYIGNYHWGPDEAVSGNGALYSNGYTLGTDSFVYARFMEQNVSDILDFYYSYDGSSNYLLTEVSRSFIDINDIRFVVLSNYLGAIDVFSTNATGANANSTPYNSAGKIKFGYIEYVNIESIAIDNIGLLPKNGQTVTYAVNLNSNYFYPTGLPESLDHIKISAPAVHETSHLVRARKDEVKVLRALVTSAYDANIRDSVTVSGGVDVTYLDPSTMDANGYSYSLPSMVGLPGSGAVQDALLASRPFGIPGPTMKAPSPLDVHLTVDVWPTTLTYNQTALQNGVTSIVEAYENKFAVDIDLKKIENDIVTTLQAKIARPYYTYDTVENIILRSNTGASALNWIEGDDDLTNPAASGNLIDLWVDGTEVEFYDYTWGASVPTSGITYKIRTFPFTPTTDAERLDPTKKNVYTLYDPSVSGASLSFPTSGTGKMRGVIRSPLNWNEYAVIHLKYNVM